ncbi:MAG: biosynthetic-type acetolactate synthase large subunit [Bacteroidaceae bacterium]|nr:biosynthetic-type acetolactate synthase large subunit [Bacteroidaceae bacterium]
MQKTLSGSRILMEALLAEGVDTLFGYPGGAIMPTYDALYDYRDRLNHILVRHEQGAAHAAEGYARVSGRTGVCLVTSGPGVTNTVTGVADAMIDSTPIVVIAGQVGAAMLGTDAFQEVDVVDMMQPVCKWAYQIRRPEDVAWAVSRAFYIAGSGRPGPVVLDFTRNAQVEEAEYHEERVRFIRSYVPVPSTSEQSLRNAAALINAARRPLVLVGQGVELGGAQAELRAFLEKADAPAGCTLLGLSALPTDHPLNMGMLGMHGALATNRMTQQADLIVAVGMRFDDRITGRLDTYARQAKKIHLDIDPSEINKNVTVDVAVLGDCKTTLPALTALVSQADRAAWRAAFTPHRDEERRIVIEPQVHPADGPLRMGEVVRRVTELTADRAVMVTDVGQNQMMAARYFRFTLPRSVVTSGGMGTMGYGLPAAIGATFGAPERTVCLFIGDGGLQMTIQELGTIMEQGAPVKIVLLNNNYLGNVRQWQQLFWQRRYSFTPMMNPDYEQVATAYGIASRTVTRRDDLDDAIREMLGTPGAFLLQCAVEEEDNVMPMCPPGHDVDDMMLTVQ